MIAILADAIDCIRKNVAPRSRRGRRIRAEAEEWILSDDNDWVFSFRNICDVVGIDAEALRRQADAWKHQELKSVAAHDSVGIAS